MPQRKNCKGSDWLWVELKRSERAELGKKTEFRFHGQTCSDKKINKNIARNVTSNDIINARFSKMPATPEGWVAMTPPVIAADPRYWKGWVSTTPPTIAEYSGFWEDYTKPPVFKKFITTKFQPFGVRYLAEEKEILYGFLKTKGRTLSKNLINNLNEFIQYLPCFECPADILRAVLFLACKAGSDQTVTVLLSRGVSPNSRDDNGTPCLMVASWYKSGNVVRCLIEAGANVVSTDRSGRTSRSLIRYSNEHKYIALVLRQKTLEYLNPLILQAAAAGRVNEIQSAIEQGADPSCAGRNGWTPLHYAAADSNFEAARVLIGAGAKINATTRSGQTPLDVTPRSIPIPNSPGTKMPTSNIIELFTANGAKKTRLDWHGERVFCEPENRKGTNRTGQRVVDRQCNKEAADFHPSPMSWQYTALGAPEALKEPQYKLTRILGLSACSAAISIDGSSYRPSAPGQASNSLRVILAKNKQGSHKSWATPPMRTPPL